MPKTWQHMSLRQTHMLLVQTDMSLE